MDDSQAAKVIRFPGKHKESIEAAAVVEVAPAPAPKATRVRTGVGVSLLAIALATVAVNQYANREHAGENGRVIASLGKAPERDAAWEKNLAERLAQPGALRTPAQLGRGATPGEELRYGLLEDRYVINWERDQANRRIQGISLGRAEPVVIDGAQLFARYGSLFSADFRTARRLAPAAPDQSRATEHATEAFELINAKGEVVSRATLAYDAERRLISVENTPVQI